MIEVRVVVTVVVRFDVGSGLEGCGQFGGWVLVFRYLGLGLGLGLGYGDCVADMVRVSVMVRLELGLKLRLPRLGLVFGLYDKG